MDVECTDISVGVHQSSQVCRFPCIHTSGTYTDTSLQQPPSLKLHFLVFKNCCLQVGQCGTFCLQVLQMLCPFSQSMIGGLMYSIHTGHSSWFKRLCSTLLNWDHILNATRTIFSKCQFFRLLKIQWIISVRIFSAMTLHICAFGETNV